MDIKNDSSWSDDEKKMIHIWVRRGIVHSVGKSDELPSHEKIVPNNHDGALDLLEQIGFQNVLHKAMREKCWCYPCVTPEERSLGFIRRESCYPIWQDLAFQGLPTLGNEKGKGNEHWEIKEQEKVQNRGCLGNSELRRHY